MQFHIFIIGNELQYQYLNYITGIPVLYKILKKIHNTGTNFYTSIVHNSVNTSIPVLRSPSTGDTFFSVSCPKGQVKKYVNVEAWSLNSFKSW